MQTGPGCRCTHLDFVAAVVAVDFTVTSQAKERWMWGYMPVSPTRKTCPRGHEISEDMYPSACLLIHLAPGRGRSEVSGLAPVETYLKGLWSVSFPRAAFL